jgi:hypothetical protein
LRQCSDDRNLLVGIEYVRHVNYCTPITIVGQVFLGYNFVAMKRVLLVCIVAIMFIQQKASDNSVRNQSQPNSHSAKNVNCAPTPSQGSPNPGNQKATGDADKNQNQKVEVVSVPKVSIKPEKDALDVTILICTIVLTVIGIAGTVVAVITLIHIKRQADTLEEHKAKFDELAKAANSNAEAAILQVRAMQEQITEMSVQSTHMEGQLGQMQTQTRLSIRPFVGLDEGNNAIQTTPLLIDESGNARVTYIIRAKNYSNTPASNVWAFANLVVADDMRTVYEWQGYARTDEVIGKPDIGQILFPGRDRVFTSMPAIAKIIKKHEGSRLQAWLVGCIGYRDQFGYLYRTEFISMFRDAAGQVAVFDPPKQPITIVGAFVPSGGAIDAGRIAKYNYGEGAYSPKNPN